MSDNFLEVEQGLERYAQIQADASKAEAYLKITDEMGPSAQLIAFINHDQKLGEELGLESFDEMELDAQHLVLSTRLKSVDMDALATETLKDTVIKYRKALLIGGFLFAMPPVFIAGIAGYVMNGKKKGECPPVKAFNNATQRVENAIRQNSLFVTALPATSDKKNWEAFLSHLPEIDSSDNAKEIPEVAIAESGWNAEAYHNAVHWFNEHYQKIKDLEKKQGEKIDALDKLLEEKSENVPEIASFVSKAVSSGTKMSKESANALTEVKTLLLSVGKFFEPKK